MTALRPATAGDRDLEALEALCAAHFSEPWTRWSFLTEIACGGYIPTAWKGETLIGFAAVRAEGDAGYLSLIAVDPAFRQLLADIRRDSWPDYERQAYDLGRRLAEADPAS